MRRPRWGDIRVSVEDVEAHAGTGDRLRFDADGFDD
jgi:hypothetical protein